MTSDAIPRRLWYETKDGPKYIGQEELPTHPEPLVILGEAGMGKTELLKWFGALPGCSYCTARQLKNARPTPHKLLGNATTLIVDALDELSVRGAGDAVDLVLQKLGELGYPRFVLSCRIADWRNATNITAICEQYCDETILILHLEALNQDEIKQLLSSRFDGDVSRAESTIAHFSERHLDGLLGNPQTLELVARVAQNGNLPHNKADLFGKAVNVLLKEHRVQKADLQPDEESALDAAGAAFAALILSGGDAIVVEAVELESGDLPLTEIASLPGASNLDVVLGSRLFAGSANRFTYLHRRIGEYVASLWLTRQANTLMKRKRLLGLFQSHGLVPASLRGLHAWLAHHDHSFTADIISADPMGVIEYGDADQLSAVNARLLLRALNALSRDNPRFREWQPYSVKCLVQPELLPDIRLFIADPQIEFGLRLLLIQAVQNSAIAEPLRFELRTVLFDNGSVFALRSAAADALVNLGSEDWNAAVRMLRDQGSEDSIRLAIDVIRSVGFDPFNNASIVGLVIEHAQTAHRLAGSLFRFEQAVPEARLDSILDELAAQLKLLGTRHDRAGNDELTDFGYSLLARRMELADVEANRLWQWLRPLDAEVGHHKESRKVVHQLIRQNDLLRRAGQRLVLLDEPGPKTVWERAYRLTSRSPGFAATPDDVVELLNALQVVEGEDEKWRDLIQLVQHTATDGAAVRQTAKRFVVNRPDMLAWIDKLAYPRVPDWKIKQDENERLRKAERAAQWKQHRQSFSEHIDELKLGKIGAIIQPANAYLSLFSDLNSQLPANERVAEWLGEDLAGAAQTGFEEYLRSDNPPTAQQVADSHAEGQGWSAAGIVVAALAERARLEIGFEGVRDDRLIAGLYELWRTRIDERAKLTGLSETLETEVYRRELFEVAIRNWLEPQIRHGKAHVDGVYALMHDDQKKELAAKLAKDFLSDLPDMACAPEEDLIDRLIESGQYDALRDIAAYRLTQSLSPDRRRNWYAVVFVVDFDNHLDRFNAFVVEDPSWVWALRRSIGNSRRHSRSITLRVDQLAWLFSAFRVVYPNVGYPIGGWSGDTNAWDASEFLILIANRLAEATSDEALKALTALRDAGNDGYTWHLRVITAEQKRKRIEQWHQPPRLEEVRAIVQARPPRSVEDLQATMIALLEQVQARVVADPADPWRDFFSDNGIPYDEERCRDHLLTMLGVRPEGVELTPEGHLADDNRADIIAGLPGMRLPIEVKGQWHDEVWRAADTQLDRLYATDYAADRRGIYLVLWFGLRVPEPKKPKADRRGSKRPESAEELRTGLFANSQSAKEGRIAIVVLNLERT